MFGHVQSKSCGSFKNFEKKFYREVKTVEKSSEGRARRTLANQIANIVQSRKVRESLGLKGYIIARYLQQEKEAHIMVT